MNISNFTYFFVALPLKLLPEEVLLLLDKNIARVVEVEYKKTNENQRQEFENELLAEQQIIYKETRKRQLESMIDNIVEAKRRKGDLRSSEEIFNDELEKSSKVTTSNMVWPILLSPLEPQHCKDVSKDLILEKTTTWKFEIYKDLWQRGYYITNGHKFGADYLVYLGDPIAYHAVFLVHCLESMNEMIHSTAIVAFGRLATAVKKRAVLACFNNNTVSYITINWIDS